MTYIESDKILQNTTPPRALKPQTPKFTREMGPDV